MFVSPDRGREDLGLGLDDTDLARIRYHVIYPDQEIVVTVARSPEPDFLRVIDQPSGPGGDNRDDVPPARAMDDTAWPCARIATGLPLSCTYRDSVPDPS